MPWWSFIYESAAILAKIYPYSTVFAMSKQALPANLLFTPEGHGVPKARLAQVLGIIHNRILNYDLSIKNK